MAESPERNGRVTIELSAEAFARLQRVLTPGLPLLDVRPLQAPAGSYDIAGTSVGAEVLNG